MKQTAKGHLTSRKYGKYPKNRKDFVCKDEILVSKSNKYCKGCKNKLNKGNETKCKGTNIYRRSWSQKFQGFCLQGQNGCYLQQEQISQSPKNNKKIEKIQRNETQRVLCQAPNIANIAKVARIFSALTKCLLTISSNVARSTNSTKTTKRNAKGPLASPNYSKYRKSRKEFPSKDKIRVSKSNKYISQRSQK